MYKKLDIIALVPSGNSYVLYLFERQEKVVIPIKMSLDFKKYIVYSNQRDSLLYPDIYNTTRRIIVGLGAKCVSITIYKYENDVFYTYLNITFQNRHLDFNIKAEDAIALAKKFSAPICIEDELLDKCGIRVNKKILRDALASDY